MREITLRASICQFNVNIQKVQKLICLMAQCAPLHLHMICTESFQM